MQVRQHETLAYVHMRKPREGAWQAHPICMSLSGATTLCSSSFIHVDQLIALVSMDRPQLCGGLGGGRTPYALSFSTSTVMCSFSFTAVTTSCRAPRPRNQRSALEKCRLSLRPAERHPTNQPASSPYPCRKEHRFKSRRTTQPPLLPTSATAPFSTAAAHKWT